MLAIFALALAVAQPAQAAAADDWLDARFVAIDAVARKADFNTATAMAKALDEEVVRKRPFDAARRYRTLRFYRAMLSRVDDEASYALHEPLIALVDARFAATDSRRLQAHYDYASARYSRRKPGASLAELEAAAVPLADIAENEGERLNAGQALAWVANELAVSGNVARARPLAARALAIADSTPTPSQRKGRIYAYLATVEGLDGRQREGIALSDRAIAVFEADQGEGQHNIPGVLGKAAVLATEIGEYQAADARLRRAVRLIDAKPGFPANVQMRTLLDYGQFLIVTGRPRLALPLLEKAATIADDAFKAGPLKDGIARSAGEAYLQLGLTAEAVRSFDRGVEWLLPLAGSSRARGLMRIDLARAQIANVQIDAAESTLSLATADLASVPAGDPARLALDAMIAAIAVQRSDAPAAIARYDAAIARFDPARQSPLYDEITLNAGIQRVSMGQVDAAAWSQSRRAADHVIGTSIALAALPGPASDRSRYEDLLDKSLAIGWAAANPR